MQTWGWTLILPRFLAQHCKGTRKGHLQHGSRGIPHMLYATKEVTKGLVALFVLLLPLLFLGSGQLTTSPAPTAVKKITLPTHANLPWLDTQRFQNHIQTRLPHYQGHFENAAKEFDIPWTLLASQGYQESRWNRNAISPTGVRGIMMLTQNTASSLGVENRLDPIQSIWGGAQYFTHLKNQIPQFIQNPDRIWIALAAYNVGMGHIKDAQALAKRLHKNPHTWNDLKTVLPLLAQKKYYKTLPHGYARGNEPVRYVTRIQAYWDLLEHYMSEV